MVLTTLFAPLPFLTSKNLVSPHSSFRLRVPPPRTLPKGELPDPPRGAPLQRPKHNTQAPLFTCWHFAGATIPSGLHRAPGPYRRASSPRNDSPARPTDLNISLFVALVLSKERDYLDFSSPLWSKRYAGE